LIQEAGAPAGAYNVVTGPGGVLGPQLINDPRVAMVTFTGSVPVGEKIRAQMGLRRATLELGSNSSVILEADCDLDLLVPRCVTGSFAHSGQVCISVQNVYIHEAIEKEFTERFVAATQKLKIGHPLEDSTEVSSMINEGEAVRVEQWISRAQSRGARVITGGQRHNATIEPAILTDVPADSEITCKEAFGPLVAIHRYGKLDEAIAAVNASEYGLQAGLCTSDIGKAFAAARRLHVGGVIINDVPAYRADHMPYGGVKNSGVGREGPQFAVEEMTELKLICWR
jgi:acyl-CoA reductase-like NAD-dependent aldehyde dehydrogenase